MSEDASQDYYLWRTPLSSEGGSAVLADVPEVVKNGSVAFDSGQKISASLTTPLRIQRTAQETGPMLDNIRTYGKWALIVSDKLKIALAQAGVTNIDWYPLTIDDKIDNVELAYWCGNIIGVVNCIDYDKSVFDEYDLFRKMSIDSSATYGFTLFRLHDYQEIHILVHASITKLLEADCTGLNFVPANGFCDLEAEPLDSEEGDEEGDDEEEYVPWT